MLFPKGTSIKDDEDLIELLEGIRRVGITGHDELDELSGLIKAKIVRYARVEGLDIVRARWWGRQVALPISRSADAMLAMAGYAKVGKLRFEAFVAALDEDTVKTDFQIRSRAR